MSYRIDYERVSNWDCAKIYDGERYVITVAEGIGHSIVKLLEQEKKPLQARIAYLEAQISAARKALENAQYTECLNILDKAESEAE